MQNLKEKEGIGPLGVILVIGLSLFFAGYIALSVWIIFPEFTDEALVPAAKLIWAFIRETLFP